MRIITISRTILLSLVLFPGWAIAQEDPHQNPAELTITADPFNHNLLQHSSPASIIGKKDLQLRGETTLGETIGLEPGVRSTYFGPGASRPVIRGNAADRVRVLKNGVGTLDVSNTSEDHAVTTNPLTAETVEILRGPETLLFGSSAIGGVVNVTDNSIPEQPIGKALSGAVDLKAGTAADELSGAIKLEGQAGGFNWHLDYFHQDTEDVDIPGFAESARLRALEAAEHGEEEEGEEHGEEEEGEEHGEEEEVQGTLPSSSTRSQGFSAGGSWVWEKGFVGVAVSGTDSIYGVPGHGHEEEGEEHDEEEEGEEHDEEEEGEEHGEEEEEEGVLIDLEQIRVDVRGAVYEVGDAIESLKFRLGLSAYEHNEIEDGGIGTVFDNEAFEGRFELVHKPIHGFRGVFGLQTQFSDFSAIGEEAFLPEVTTFSPAVFLFEEADLNEKLKIQLGGRYEFVDYDVADGNPDEIFHPFSLSAGLVWDLDGTSKYTAGFSVAYTQRAPSPTELYANGTHVARNIFEVGDEALDLERSKGIDLTFKKNTGLVTGGVNVFVQDYDDYINLDRTGEEEDGLEVFNYASVPALFWGFETEATLHIHQLMDLWANDLDLGAQVDFVRASSDADDEDLPRIPPLRTVVHLEHRYRDLLESRVEGVFVAEQNRVSGSELETDSHQLLNASVQYNVLNTEDYTLGLYVRGSNLTDEEARVHSSFLKDLAPLPGRNFTFGIRGTF